MSSDGLRYCTKYAMYVFSILVRGDATAGGGGRLFFLHSPHPPPSNSQNPASGNKIQALIDKAVKQIDSESWFVYKSATSFSGITIDYVYLIVPYVVLNP